MADAKANAKKLLDLYRFYIRREREGERLERTRLTAVGTRQRRRGETREQARVRGEIDTLARRGGLAEAWPLTKALNRAPRAKSILRAP